MKMSQVDLAEKVYLSASFLGLIERGHRKASMETLIAICEALDVPPDYLLQDSLRNAPRNPADEIGDMELLNTIQSMIEDHMDRRCTGACI